MDVYLTIEDARDLAATMASIPGVAALLDLTDEALGSVLLASTMDINSAMRYQGERVATDQVLAFPRRDARHTYDLDHSTGQAVVPESVKAAVLLQAAFLNSPQAADAAQRLDAIRTGLASQSIGSLSESYTALRDLGSSSLCDRSMRLMSRYRLRTGGLL